MELVVAYDFSFVTPNGAVLSEKGRATRVGLLPTVSEVSQGTANSE
jgi:hypothetical protein